MSIRVGDLVRFKATGKVCVYLGMADGCYTFHNNEYGRVELSELHFNPENLEVL
jgi:hypothetical protein